MAITLLDDAAFEATVLAPMRGLVDEPPPVSLSLKAYVTEAAGALAIATSPEAMTIPHVFVSAEDRYTHVLFEYGVLDTYLVIVVDNREKAIVGHRILDMRKLYGLERSPFE